MVDRKNIGFAIDNFGFSIGNSEINGIQKTTWGDDDRPVEQGTFSSNHYLYALIYAQNYSPELLYGITLKKYAYLIDKYTADGLGMDIGGMYRYPETLFSSTLILGASLHNAGRTKINWSTGHSDTIPMSLTVGAALYSSVLDRTLVLTSDLVQQESTPLQIRNGAEYWLAEKVLTVRAGTDTGKFTIGLGLQYADVSIDYAQADYNDLGLIKRISCKVVF
jgi:hypothetical protein